MARVDLFRAVKEEPGSIAEIALRLHRDRSAVKREVDVPESAGLGHVEARPLRGSSLDGRIVLLRLT